MIILCPLPVWEPIRTSKRTTASVSPLTTPKASQQPFTTLVTGKRSAPGFSVCWIQMKLWHYHILQLNYRLFFMHKRVAEDAVWCHVRLKHLTLMRSRVISWAAIIWCLEAIYGHDLQHVVNTSVTITLRLLCKYMALTLTWTRRRRVFQLKYVEHEEKKDDKTRPHADIIAHAAH